MSRILIEYCPEISEEATETITQEVTPSMVSEDNSTNQYAIDMVYEALKDAGLDDDLAIIDELINEGVSYIEF